MTDVMHQNSRLYGFRFTVKDEIAFGCELLDSFAHEIE